MGSAVFEGAVTAKIPITQIIAVDEDDVRRVGRHNESPWGWMSSK
jgi:hypothetical protein